MSAYDGARAAAVLWRGGEVHVIADYSLLRVVVENAALAWWVLQGTDRDDRMHRAFRVVTDDLTWASKRENFAVAHARTVVGREKRSGALAGATRELERVTTAFRSSRTRATSTTPCCGGSLLWWIASTSARGSLSVVPQLALPAEAGQGQLLSGRRERRGIRGAGGSPPACRPHIVERLPAILELRKKARTDGNSIRRPTDGSFRAEHSRPARQSQ